VSDRRGERGRKQRPSRVIHQSCIVEDADDDLWEERISSQRYHGESLRDDL
jgi:hypothetical protein